MASESPMRLPRRAWHPVCLSKDLPINAVRGVTLLETELVLARLSDGLLAADVGCPHKGTRLNLGTVADGDLQCPTHCWRFDSEGNCTNLPPLLDPSLQKMAAASLRVYQVRERYGIIWVQLEPDNSLKIPEIQELSRSNWLPQFGEPLEFQCGPRRAIEGFLDVSRFTPNGARLPNFYLETFDGTVPGNPEFAARADFTDPCADDDPLREPHERTYRGFAPGTVTLRQKWSYGERLWLLTTCPVSLERSLVFWALAPALHFEGPEIGDQLSKALEELKTIGATCGSQTPPEMPADPDRAAWGILVTAGDVISDQFQRAHRLWSLRLGGQVQPTSPTHVGSAAK